MNHALCIPSDSKSRYEQLIIVGIVVLLHAALFAGWKLQPEEPALLVNELSVSFAQVQMQQADVIPQPKREQREPTPLAAEQAADPQEETSAQQDVTPASPVVLDSEPDYRADYLHNPRPPYPLAARRMGYHGKVVLNVEVLAEGRAGEVLLQQSSGHDLLDQAALQTVKTWRFTPAKRLGQPVTHWFLVPIKYSLEGSDA